MPIGRGAEQIVLVDDPSTRQPVTNDAPEKWGSFMVRTKPIVPLGSKTGEIPAWMRIQTAGRVEKPPVSRPAACGYQGHSLLVQKEIVDEKTASEAKPQIRLHAYNMQQPPALSPADLRLARGFPEGAAEVKLTANRQWPKGYTGFQRGKKCKEDLGDLETSKELEEELRQLSKGINGVTFSQYNVLRSTPTTSMQQDEINGVRPREVLVRGYHKHLRLQSAETSYADAYAKMNQGVGPFASREKPTTKE